MEIIGFKTTEIVVIARIPPECKISGNTREGLHERTHQGTGGTKKTAPSQLQGQPGECKKVPNVTVMVELVKRGNRRADAHGSQWQARGEGTVASTSVSKQKEMGVLCYKIN